MEVILSLACLISGNRDTIDVGMPTVLPMWFIIDWTMGMLCFTGGVPSHSNSFSRAAKNNEGNAIAFRYLARLLPFL